MEESARAGQILCEFKAWARRESWNSAGIVIHFVCQIYVVNALGGLSDYSLNDCWLLFFKNNTSKG